MRIATWNLERLEKNKDLLIVNKLVAINADILILTETNDSISIDNYNCISTSDLPAHFDGVNYSAGEKRVSILTKYKLKSQHKTFDSFTTVCVDVETPHGILTVYGSIIGVFANRQPRFDNDLYGQLSDFDTIFPNREVCFAGDLNVTFSGHTWPSQKARQILLDTFLKFNLKNITANIKDTVDHIILSDSFLGNPTYEIETWNLDKKLSDHVGNMITLSKWS